MDYKASSNHDRAFQKGIRERSLTAYSTIVSSLVSIENCPLEHGPLSFPTVNRGIRTLVSPGRFSLLPSFLFSLPRVSYETVTPPWLQFSLTGFPTYTIVYLALFCWKRHSSHSFKYFPRPSPHQNPAAAAAYPDSSDSLYDTRYLLSLTVQRETEEGGECL